MKCVKPGDRSSTLGLVADASISIPLLGGSGADINTESLTQAERNVIYALWEFERYKRTFAVSVFRSISQPFARMSPSQSAKPA